MKELSGLNLNSYLALQTEINRSNDTNNNKTTTAEAKTTQPWPQINQPANRLTNAFISYTFFYAFI